MFVLATIGLLAAPAPLPPQEPDLLVLARLNRIMKVSGYDGPTPTIETVVTYASPTTPLIPRGLEIDRATGDFFVLFGGYPASSGPQLSELHCIDKTSGQTLFVVPIPGTNLDGLEQRSDGEFFAVDSGARLVRIDVRNGSFSSVPLTPPLPDNHLGLTIDPSGRILAAMMNTPADDLYAIDPVDGSVTTVGALPGPIMGLEADDQGRLFHGGFFFADGIRIFYPAAGVSFPIAGTQITSNVYALRFAQSVDGEGVQHVCDGLPNSTGVGATLEMIGTTEIARNDLTFYSRDLPRQSAGFFLTGSTVAFQTVGSGRLCIGAPQYRYSLFPLYSGTSGSVRFDIDLFTLPSGGAPFAGRTEVFQYWYRDFGSTTNLSDALAVTLR